jgi:hypothetical protein
VVPYSKLRLKKLAAALRAHDLVLQDGKVGDRTLTAKTRYQSGAELLGWHDADISVIALHSAGHTLAIVNLDLLLSLLETEAAYNSRVKRAERKAAKQANEAEPVTPEETITHAN